jgi:hypothetical protein
LIAGKFHWQTGGGSLNSHLSDQQRDTLKDDFFSYLFEFTREKWHWAPLNSIIGADYKGDSLILSNVPESSETSHQEICKFLEKPLFVNATKYAGIKARSAEHAKEKLGVLLGALFLCMHSGTQYFHTMGKPTSDLLFFENGMTIYSTRAHLPYLANKIAVTDADFPLLSRVEELLNGDGVDRKLVRSLRWLSTSWFANGAERFSLICQSIDALTPSHLRTMKAKCEWIRDQLGQKVAQEPIELLFKTMRSDIAHGDAPSLIESKAYLEFLSRFGVDPELAAVEIVRKVLVDRFIPYVVVRENPIYNYPEFIESQIRIFSRYGIDFTFSTGFPFDKLSG